MKNVRVLAALTVLTVGCSPSINLYVFKDVRGPLEETRIPASHATSWTTYHQGSPSRLAILLTDPDSAWLGLVHGLKTIGVPFLVTKDYQEALRSRVVLVYPMISGRVLSPDALRALAAFPRSGGTLLAVNVLGGGLSETFGFRTAVPSRSHHTLKFNSEQVAAYSLLDPKERLLQLIPRTVSSGMGTYAYTQPATTPLAIYDDGSAAILQNTIGSGKAVALGVDVGAFILQGYNNRDMGVERAYVNDFEPATDVFLRLIKGLYVAGEKNAVTLATVPDNKSLAVLITHDIDYTRSVENALTYAAYEKQHGISATYFLQTKYIRDYNDDIFFNDKKIPAMKQLLGMGMELASHTVSHSKAFGEFPLGTGRELYPDYRPFVRSAQVTRDGSILGELRVSKFLIERMTGAPPVTAFRPGELANPLALPQALAATGYRYSSSVTADESLTHWPFQLTYNRETTAEVGVFEFPITIEDEAGTPMLERLPQALELAHKIGRYGGWFVLLIHPNVVGPKMEFERRFIQAVKDSSWFGTVSQMGAWWSARNRVEIDVEEVNGHPVVRVRSPQPVDHLVLQIPDAWSLDHCDPPAVHSKRVHGGVLLNHLEKDARLTF